VSTNSSNNPSSSAGVNIRPTTQAEADVFKIIAEVRHRFWMAIMGGVACFGMLAYMICCHKEFNSAILGIAESVFGGTLLVIFSYYFKVDQKKSRIPIIALSIGILAVIIASIALWQSSR
jgi:1,4-dihydroxy-2-naphthoate octaprenyltransferase